MIYVDSQLQGCREDDDIVDFIEVSYVFWEGTTTSLKAEDL